MSWWWKRRRERPERDSDGERAAKEPVSDRRAFFRIGGARVRDSGIDALRALSRASHEFQDAAEGRPSSASRAAGRGARRAASPDGLAKRVSRPAIRPPGAIAEASFRVACTSCDRCVDACPEGAIITAPSGSAAGEGTPILRVHATPCVLCSEVPCASSCPTGALRPLSAAHIKIGLAVVFRDLCLNHLPGEDCEVCVDQCPTVPSALTRGEDGYPVVAPQRCTGCGLCVVQCPAYPAALHVTPA